jgi:hypothetical protein
VVPQRSTVGHAAGLSGRLAAFHVAFWWSIGFTAVAIVLAYWLPTRTSS